MGGREHHVCGRAIAVSPQPVRRRHAPAVPWHEPGEPERRHRRAEVVADATLMFKELAGHHRANRVAPLVLRPRAAAPISIEPGDWVGAARLQLTTKYITIAHPGSIAHARMGLMSTRPQPIRERRWISRTWLPTSTASVPRARGSRTRTRFARCTERTRWQCRSRTSAST